MTLLNYKCDADVHSITVKWPTPRLNLFP